MDNYWYSGHPYSDWDGHRCWFDENGDIHRDGGPAFISSDGNKQWMQHGKVHREDGPAIEWNDGRTDDKWWYYRNERIFCKSQREFEKMLKIKAFW